MGIYRSGVYRSELDVEAWVITPDGLATRPKRDDWVDTEALEAQQRGDFYLHRPTEGQEARTVIRELLATGRALKWKDVPEERWPERVDHYHVYFDGGRVGFSATEPIAEEYLALIRRFGEVFGFAHSRWEELKQKEAYLQVTEAELQTAHDMQMGLMPISPPSVEGFDVTGRCVAANHVGGDLFQYFRSGKSLSIALADVTGKAMDAAFPVVMFGGILDNQMEQAPPLEELFPRLNSSLHRSLDSRTFICFEMAEIDTESGTVRYSNGGLPYPYHFHDGEVSELQVDTYPLGVRPDTEYDVIERQLAEGDYLVICSDGFAEAENEDGEHLAMSGCPRP